MEEEKGELSPFVPGNDVKPTRDLTKERDQECIPAAIDLLALLGSKKDLVIGTDGTYTIEDVANYYSKMYVDEVAPYLLAKNIKADDVSYVFKIMLQAVGFLSDRVTMSVKNHYDNATALKWGVKDTGELRLMDIHQTLMANVKKPETPGDK